MVEQLRRRHFLRQLGVSAVAGPLLPARVWGVEPNFTGDFLLYIQVDGGWDVASYCDPKMNPSEGRPINNWAKEASIQSAGNLHFAPIANNAEFFQTHYEKTLVINGINARTNIHSAGAHFNHTGSIDNHMPHLAALYAYEASPNMAMPVMASSQFEAAGLITPAALNPAALELINPNLWDPASGDTLRYLPKDDLSLIRTFRQVQAGKAANQISTINLLQKQKQQMLDYYRAAIADTHGFEHFQDVFYELNEGKFKANRYTTTLKTALTAFKSGLGIAADVPIKGFDTHEEHDLQFAERVTLLNDAVSCAWHYAEQLGIANRLVVVMASDFGRAPWYNRQNGKDHWPYGSTLVMKKNMAWTNRVVGYTDEGHVGQPINPFTLNVDKMNGVEIEPGHVMQALRQLLGLANSESAAKFQLAIEQEFNFFNT
ncbi:DUF1501 domain-containing protein [Marinagarivorans cellulosilyticus]|uniref:DUF1501 domain-containing protein n=1 Tax=Marinagarivorans cellulosilyticus TaxID=2721545 RepID=A0AAN1WG66_9GAMM|nr:DUF1501 domain-containing protein [Marinagarivorans cellulosilyticus]BCD97012.1 hypothetical protein MARGE09_P1212 [Marinagarivorans cellulosilyticus]